MKRERREQRKGRKERQKERNKKEEKQRIKLSQIEPKSSSTSYSIVDEQCYPRVISSVTHVLALSSTVRMGKSAGEQTGVDKNQSNIETNNNNVT